MLTDGSPGPYIIDSSHDSRSTGRRRRFGMKSQHDVVFARNGLVFPQFRIFPQPAPDIVLFNFSVHIVNQNQRVLGQARPQQGQSRITNLGTQKARGNVNEYKIKDPVRGRSRMS